MAIKIKPIDINARGLEMFLGSLEAACMRAIWADWVTSHKIWQHVRENYKARRTIEEIAYTSVTTTIFRLWKMGYLTRIGDRHEGYYYTPIHATEAEFVNVHICAAINALLENYPQEAGQVIVNRLRAYVGAAKKMEPQ